MNSNLTPLEQLIAYIRKRYEINTSFENLINDLQEQDAALMEFEKEQSYNQGHSDGYNEALNTNDEYD